MTKLTVLHPAAYPVLQKLSGRAGRFFWVLVQERDIDTNIAIHKAKSVPEAKRVSVAYDELYQQKLIIRTKRPQYLINPSMVIPSINIDIIQKHWDNLVTASQSRQAVYILELQENKWYVGFTTNIGQRMRCHFNKPRVPWVKKYPPIRVACIIKDADLAAEEFVTQLLMIEKGWQNVRGAGWCQRTLKKPPQIFQKIHGPLQSAIRTREVERLFA